MIIPVSYFVLTIAGVFTFLPMIAIAIIPIPINTGSVPNSASAGIGFNFH